MKHWKLSSFSKQVSLQSEFLSYPVSSCVEFEKLIKNIVHDLKVCIIGQEKQSYTNTALPTGAVIA